MYYIVEQERVTRAYVEPGEIRRVLQNFRKRALLFNATHAFAGTPQLFLATTQGFRLHHVRVRELHALV